MKTINEAYDFAMNIVKELKESGLEVSIKPSKNLNKTIMTKLPLDKWRHITFKTKNGEDAKKVREAAKYLGMCGISFDSSANSEVRDWEFDWSFEYHKGEEDWDGIESRDIVERIIEEDCGYKVIRR